MPHPAPFEPGMLVALKSGRVGILRSSYEFSPRSVPSCAHRRFKVEVGQAHFNDVTEQEIVGRVTFKKMHLRAVGSSAV